MMQHTETMRRITGLVIAAGLAGCGGGGSDAGSPPAPAPAPGTTATTSATCGIAGFSTTAMARINQWRAAGADCGSEGRFAATTALAWNDTLAQVATGHSQDMATNNFFSHTGSGGSTLQQRIDASGYAWSGIAENIAAGPVSVNAAIDGWIASPGHCANLMAPEFTEVGLACVPGGSANTYGSYWTMNLARPR